MISVYSFKVQYKLLVVNGLYPKLPIVIRILTAGVLYPYTLHMISEQLPIIYQDHHLIIVNKPAGLVIHPTYKNADGTMWDALLLYLEQQESDNWQPPELPDELAWAGAPPHIQMMLREKRTERLWKEDGWLSRPCLLHRLDKDTSGIVALARTERSRRYLVHQFHDHSIVKRYLAVVQKGAYAWSHPRTIFTLTRKDVVPEVIEGDASFALEVDVEFLLDGPLQRDPDDRRRCVVGPDGQAATTKVKVLAESATGDFYLLDVRPITGRTHQIRAHLSALGYAIVGDQLYAPQPVVGTPQAAMRRQFLHAHSLTLRRYPDQVQCNFVAPLATDLLSWMNEYFPSGLGVIHASNVIPT